MKIIDFGVAHYFESDDLIRANERYDTNKQRILKTKQRPINELNNKILALRNDNPNVNNNDFNTVLNEHSQIQVNLNRIVPTFTDFAAFRRHEQNEFNNNNNNNRISFTHHNIVGKPSYMAPEVAERQTINLANGGYRREATYDARKADIWSLGVC